MNEITLSADIKQIELEINHHKNVAGQSIWEIGRRLNHVKENDLAHGEFMEWVSKLGINQPEANRMMKVANEIPNSSTLSNLGSTALYLIATLPEEERTKEHTTHNGESKTPDDMTVRELQELKKQLNRSETQLKISKQSNETKQKDIDRLIKKNNELSKSKEPVVKVVEKEVVVETIPADYESIKKSLNQLTSRNEHLESEHQKLLDQRQEVNDKSLKFDQLNEAIQLSQGKLNQSQKTISEYNDLHKLLKQSNEFLTKASTLIYSDIAGLVQTDELARKEMSYLLERLERFNRDINNLLHQDLIIEGEIISE